MTSFFGNLFNDADMRGARTLDSLGPLLAAEYGGSFQPGRGAHAPIGRWMLILDLVPGTDGPSDEDDPILRLRAHYLPRDFFRFLLSPCDGLGELIGGAG